MKRLNKDDLEILLAVKELGKEKEQVSFGDVLEYFGLETLPGDFEQIYEMTDYGKAALEHLNNNSNITIH